ncbi:MAG: hypothetical protein ACKV2T_39100 [Kofleriaceae bacterium]
MRLASLFLVSLVAAGAACDDISVTALTVPPPGKVADLDDESLEMKLSRGIAIGFECYTTMSSYYGPCRDARVKVTDESVAKAFASYLDSTAESHDGGPSGPRARTAFAVVGLEPGETELEVITSDSDITVSVKVVP